VKKPTVKGKRSSVSAAHSRNLNMVKSLGNMSSNIVDKAERGDSSFSPINFLSTNQVGQVNSGRPRRKMEKPKPMVQQDHTMSENKFSGQHDKSIASYWRNSMERHKVNFLPFVHGDNY